MSELVVWGLIGLGLVIILALLAYIFRLVRRLRVLKAEQTQIQSKADAKQASLKLSIVDSLKVITTVMLDDQVELSEGCLRVKVLIDNLDPSLHDDERFKIFTVMAEKLSHMPTHEARKQTEKKLIRKLDAQRFKLEREHREEIRAAAKSLRTWLERPLKVVE